jgi:hypothetical protein
VTDEVIDAKKLSILRGKSPTELLEMWQRRAEYPSGTVAALELILAERQIGAPGARPTKVTPPVPPPAIWEVQLQDGEIRKAATPEELIPDILSGVITGDQPCRRTQPPRKDKAPAAKWAQVANTIGTASFRTRLLFRPVWAHSLRGGEIGLTLGFVIWLGMNVFSSLSAAATLAGYHNPDAHRASVKLAAYGVVSTFWLLQALPMVANALPFKWMQSLAGAVAPYAFKVAAGFMFLLFVQSGAPDAVLGGLVPGFSAAFGSLVGGGLAGGPPGMVIGTVVGLIRAPDLAKAPASSREKLPALLLKGIALPLVVSAAAVTLYLKYASDLMQGVAKVFLR